MIICVLKRILHMKKSISIPTTGIPNSSSYCCCPPDDRLQEAGPSGPSFARGTPLTVSLTVQCSFFLRLRYVEFFLWLYIALNGVFWRQGGVIVPQMSGKAGKAGRWWMQLRTQEAATVLARLDSGKCNPNFSQRSWLLVLVLLRSHFVSFASDFDGGGWCNSVTL